MTGKLFTTDFSQNPNYFMNGNIKDHSQRNVVEDNFNEAIKYKLTQPTRESEVAEAVCQGLDVDVVLWRGTTAERVAHIEKNGSAGGIAPEYDTKPPGEASVRTQVAFGSSLPEFTTNPNLGFSFRHWLVVVFINSQYLAKGSGSEGGWVCNASAPVMVIEKVDRTLGFPEPPFINAS